MHVGQPQTHALRPAQDRDEGEETGAEVVRLGQSGDHCCRYEELSPTFQIVSTLFCPQMDLPRKLSLLVQENIHSSCEFLTKG